ncbi:MAG: hypothetical protein P9X24_13145, partial [Candidatus Hatepunaea meridiana]|nr:hypothetical protein [Candidatus Hatepunaea meridiana]
MKYLKYTVLLGVVSLFMFETASAQGGSEKWKPFAEGKHLYWNSPSVLELRDESSINAIVSRLQRIGHSVDALNQTNRVIVLMFGDVLRAEDILIFYRGEKSVLYTYSLQAEENKEKQFIDFLKDSSGGSCCKPSYLNEIKYTDYYDTTSVINKNRFKMVKFLRVLHSLWKIDGINSMSLKFWDGRVVSARNVPRIAVIKEVEGVKDRIHYDIRNQRINNLYVSRELSKDILDLDNKVIRLKPIRVKDKNEVVDPYSRIGKGLVNLYVDNAGNAVQVKLPGNDINWMDGQSFPIRKMDFNKVIGEEELKSSRDFFNLALLNPVGVTATMHYNTEVKEHPVSRILTPTKNKNLGKYAQFTSVIYVNPVGTPGGALQPSPDDMELVIGLWDDKSTNRKFITDIFGFNNLPDYIIDGNTRNMKVTFAEGKIERGYWTKIEKPDTTQV